MYCPNCHIEVEKGKFCPDCGTKLIEPKTVNYCPNCNTTVEKGKFCPECGSKLVVKNVLTDETNSRLHASKENNEQIDCPACGFPNEIGTELCVACGFPISGSECEEKQDELLISPEYESILAKYRGIDGDLRHLNEEEFELAFDELSTLAVRNITEAQLFLGLMYYDGQGTEKDEKKAFELIHKAELAGNKIAYAAMGSFYMSGNVVPQDLYEARKRIFSLDTKSLLSIQGMILTEEGDYTGAFEKYTAAGEDGYSGLGKLYLEGFGVKKDTKKAFDLFMMAAASGDADAESQLGRMYLYGEGVDINLEQALYWTTEAAKHGDVDGMLNLAKMYVDGNGVPQDYETSAEWYKRAAALKNPYAEFQLGHYYTYVLKDHKKAFAWYKKAAEKNFPDALYELSQCYRFGYGVEQDDNKADELLHKAISAGYVINDDAETRILEECFEENGLIDTALQMIDRGEYDEALSILRPLANSGDSEAQYQLAACYAKGHGVKQNLSVATSWLNKAAASGHILALYSLGQKYEEGHGVQINEEQAVKWYRKAADLGHADSQFRLGRMYNEGRGVNQNTKKAKELLQIARKNGSEEAHEYYESLKNKPTATITKIRFVDGFVYKGQKGIKIQVDFDADNVKGRELNCSVNFFHDEYHMPPITVDATDPQELSVMGCLVVGANDTPDNKDVRYTDVSFVVPYSILCNHNSKGTWPIVARVIIWDMGTKTPTELTQGEKKFKVTCNKRLFSDPTYEVTW